MHHHILTLSPSQPIIYFVLLLDLMWLLAECL